MSRIERLTIWEWVGEGDGPSFRVKFSEGLIKANAIRIHKPCEDSIRFSTPGVHLPFVIPDSQSSQIHDRPSSESPPPASERSIPRTDAIGARNTPREGGLPFYGDIRGMCIAGPVACGLIRHLKKTRIVGVLTIHIIYHK